MKISYIIDNQTHQLADVLNYLLSQQNVQAMDIATAYFTIRGYTKIATNDAESLIEAVRSIQSKMGSVTEVEASNHSLIQRADLHLVCFDYVWS